MKKFFQTENELKIKKKKAAPALIKFKPIKIPKKAKDNLTGMWNDFRDRQVKNSNGIDYFSENFNVVDLFNDSKAVGKTNVANSISHGISKSIEDADSSSLHLNEAKINDDNEKSTNNSSVTKALATLPQVKSPTLFKTPSNRRTMLAQSVGVDQSPNSLVRVTRRTSMLALASPSVDRTSVHRNPHVLPEEITEITDSNDNQTNNHSVAMEITPKVVTSPKVISNRKTIHASSSMDITDQRPFLASSRKRNSVIPAKYKDFEVNTKKYLGKNSTDTDSHSEKNNRRRTVFASSSSTFSTLKKVDEEMKSLPNKRRTLNASKQTTFSAIDASSLNLGHESTFAPNEASSPLVVNKDEEHQVTNLRRTLFKSTPSPLALTPVTKANETKATNSKRRRTILPPSETASSSSLIVSTLKKAAESNGASSSRRQTVFTPSNESLNSSGTLVSNTSNEVQNRRRTCFTTSHTTGNQSTPASKGKRAIKLTDERLRYNHFFHLFSQERQNQEIA